MAGPLAANPAPFSFDLGGSPIYVGGALTGLAYYESSPTKATRRRLHPDGSEQCADHGAEDGRLVPILTSRPATIPSPPSARPTPRAACDAEQFRRRAVAYIKLQGAGGLADFSFQAGKLPTLTGDEYNFTFENMNIERGLLWNIEPAISRGLQANYSNGPLSASVSINDGYYSMCEHHVGASLLRVQPLRYPGLLGLGRYWAAITCRRSTRVRSMT